MDILERVLKKILGKNPVLSQGLQDARILETWPLAVGESLAKHARAVQVKGKTLLVEVDHPIWKQELHSNKQLALKRLNEKLNEYLTVDPTGETPRKEPKIYIEDLFLLSKSPTRTKPELG